MYGIVWKYLPQGSWRLAEKVYDDKEKAETVATQWKSPEWRETHAKAIYLGDAGDWK